MDPVNHSYFFCNDTLYDWGYRSYFSYYSEFGRTSGWWLGPVEATVLMLIFVISIAANVCLALVIYRYKELRTVTNYFILNLALADGLFATSIPCVALIRLTETWVLKNALCRLIPYFQFVCGAVLLWTLTLISFERYQRIVVQGRSRFNGKNTICTVTMIWIGCLIFFIPVAIWFTVLEFPYGPKSYVAICTLVFPNSSLRISYIFIVTTLIGTCLSPIIWMVYNYYSIFRKLINNERLWQERYHSQRRPNSQVSNDSNCITGQMDHTRIKKHYRTVKILCLDVCVTVILWSPIIIIMGLIHYDSSEKQNFFMHSQYFIISLMAALLNTCLNPILYGLLSTNFRVCLKRYFSSCICNSKHRNKQLAHLSLSVSSQVFNKRSSIATPSPTFHPADTPNCQLSPNLLINTPSSSQTPSPSSETPKKKWNSMFDAFGRNCSIISERVRNIVKH